ncbi:hypothetical protein, partial [Saccharothrix sp. Mg75]|uniref:hypothetical protein n=1 Tax=Saccharothrix sp. Mg75 TaxID=3445357 RepID=UPI003EED46B0
MRGRLFGSSDGLSFTGASPRSWVSAARCRAGSAGLGGTLVPPNQTDPVRPGPSPAVGVGASGVVVPRNGAQPSSFGGEAGGRAGRGD